VGFIYLTADSFREQLCKPIQSQNSFKKRHYHNEMRAQTIGRVLGIGVRLAGRAVGQSVAAAASAPKTSSAPRVEGRAAGQTSRNLASGVSRGVGGFLRPFARVGSILWLEVTGVFFLLPVLTFAPTLWRIRMSYAHGPEQSKFWVTAGIVALFLYLSVSSFWRARKK